MKYSRIFAASVACTISCPFPSVLANDVNNINKAMSELNSSASVRIIRRRTWLVGVVILLLCPNTFAESDFSTFWKKFKTAVIASDKAVVADMTKFPLSMPYEVKAVNNKETFLRRYNEIFKGEADAARCFGAVEPHKDSDRRYEIFCPFKETPKDTAHAPIRFIFELTKTGWKFVGLDNINE